jgi:hypothetical protein
MSAPVTVWLTVADVVRIYHVKSGHVYVLAHRHHWRRIRVAGVVAYDSDSVDRALGRAA